MEIGSCAAILLAGGYSSRMGRDKAELEFDGRRLIELQLSKLLQAGVAEIVISGYAKPLAGTVFVPDVYPHRGPLSGIHAGLLAIHRPSALVLAVDTPLVPVSLLKELVSSHEGGARVVSHDGSLEPLIGIYDRSLAPACETALLGPSSSMHRFLREIGCSELPYQGDPTLLMNCNTPEEYRLACSRLTEAPVYSRPPSP